MENDTIETAQVEQGEANQKLDFFHPDRVLTRFDEITAHDIVRENVGAIQGWLRVKTMHLPDDDPTHLKVTNEIRKMNADYLQLGLNDVVKLKAFGRYLDERLKEIDDGKI